MNKLTLRLVSIPIVWLSLWSLVVQPSFSQTKASDPPKVSYKAQLAKTKKAIKSSKKFSFEESNDLISQALTTLVSTTANTGLIIDYNGPHSHWSTRRGSGKLISLYCNVTAMNDENLCPF